MSDRCAFRDFIVINCTYFLTYPTRDCELDVLAERPRPKVNRF